MESLLGLGSHVQTTWLVSLTAQVVALSLAIAAVVQDDVRSAFFSVLVLELIISSIQFVWYCVFFVLIFTMIVTLNILIKAWADECASIGDILTFPFVIGNVVAVIFNTAMLHGGYRVESGRVETERESLVIAMSTFWFFFAFLPSVIFVTEDPSLHGILVLLLTWIVWCAYAVNLWVHRTETETRASIYNLLDIVSKNVFAVAVAIQVLAAGTRTCP